VYWLFQQTAVELFILLLYHRTLYRGVQVAPAEALAEGYRRSGRGEPTHAAGSA